MCNDLLENIENALVRNATARRLFASTPENPQEENAVMETHRMQEMPFATGLTVLSESYSTPKCSLRGFYLHIRNLQCRKACFV